MIRFHWQCKLQYAVVLTFQPQTFCLDFLTFLPYEQNITTVYEKRVADYQQQQQQNLYLDTMGLT